MKYVLSFIVLIITSCKTETEQQRKYRIAYNVFAPDTINKDNYEVFTMNMDGSDKKNVTNNKDVAWAYYAVGKRLFFVSDRDSVYRSYYLYETDAKGSFVKKVTNLRLEDSWMSSRNNGEELVVSGRIGKEVRYQLFIVNTKTGEYKQVTNDTADLYRDPVFSPDGKKIVCAYQKNKRDDSLHEELYVMNEDGSGMIQLTYYPKDDTSKYSHHYKAGPPRWNAKENFISYHSFQEGNNALYAVTPDGKKQWKLTGNVINEGWHDWSPDFKWLAFETLDTNDKQKQYHIILMNWETKEIKTLTDKVYQFQMGPVFVEE